MALYKTCLLIDDNYIDNFVTSRLLESCKFADNIVVRQSSAEAIEALRDGSLTPDVIFLDLRMPGMDGFEFLQEFDKLEINKEAIKVFMLSSSLDPTDLRRSHANKYITQFVHKPITRQVLEELS
ncbi:response regulator [Mucilaginibacter auburnensis]|uniref:CheY-like chemotaxis protein n=1 Tax=Mucilaginibacter auburnensis TaxID=1457233 RepID=A0A2H9VPC7_9SPHI|nr:response regulator [Mucilaginibacter auburnensis]PJJ80162.1 CheY-like chemotaxis protein [Mucilaginibacter auburnensis]